MSVNMKVTSPVGSWSDFGSIGFQGRVSGADSDGS